MKKFIKFTVSLLTVLLLCTIGGLVACNKPQGGDEDSSSPIMTNEQKLAVYNGTYGEDTDKSGGGTYYGVGRTLNVITDEYIEVSAIYSKIFDTDKLLARDWRKSFAGKMEAVTVSGSSMSDYYGSMNTQYGASLNGNINAGIFSAGLGMKFGSSITANRQNVKNEIYYTFSQIYSGTLIEIDEYGTLSNFGDILNSNVLDDAKKVEQGRMEPEDFMLKYGTHAVLAGYYGGRVDCNYYLNNTGTKWSASQENKLQADVGVSVSGLFSASVGAGYSIREELGLESEQVDEKFSASSIGGANFPACSLSDFTANYRIWSDSMNDQAEYGNIVGLPKRSLAAIWDMFPSGYSEAKQILKDYFDKNASAVSNAFLDKYGVITDDSSDDPIDYTGGNGTESNPYIINNKEEFKNIANNRTAHYKLGGSVNLGVWNSPFEFGGVLDGNGYTISYSQTSKENSNYLSGLFTKLNDATVRNLKLTANISRNMSGDRIGKVGGLAGTTSGEVKISKVSVNGVISVYDSDGYGYVGGLVGMFCGGMIEECANNAQVSSFARNARTGGIVGYASPTEIAVAIENCYNTGSLESKSAHTAAYGGRASGGIAGQVHGHNAFSLKIKNCYNDSRVQLVWAGVATGGWYGGGGIIGDIENGIKTNVSVENSYWNKSKCTLAGNNAEFNAGGKTDMTGTYSGWSDSVWDFYSDSAPKLKWMN